MTGPTGPGGLQVIYATTTPYTVAAGNNNDQLIIIDDLTTVPPEYYQLGANGANNTVYTVETDNTNSGLYIGGTFTSINGSAVNLVAKTNTSGTVTDTLNNGIANAGSSYIQALEYNQYTAPDELYAGGSFTYSQTGTLLNNIGKYDTVNWKNMGNSPSPGLNNIVNTIHLDTTLGQVYIGGNFTQDSNSNNMKYISYYSPGAVNTFSPVQDPDITPYGVTSTVYAVETDGTYIYVGGNFSKAGERDASNVARYHFTLKTWEPLFGEYGDTTPGYTNYTSGQGTNNVVRALYWDAGYQRLYVGGDFTTVQSGQFNSSYVAYWSPSGNGVWRPLYGSSGVSQGVDGPVYCITGDGSNRIFIGGTFIDADIGNNIGVNYITYWNQGSQSWNQMLGTNFQPGTSAQVRCVNWVPSSPYLSGNSGLFVGGDFQYVDYNTQLANNVACWLPSGTGLWMSLYASGASPPNTPGTDGPVYGIAYTTATDALYIGGSFENVYINTGTVINYPYIVAYDLQSGGGTNYLYGDWDNSITSVDGAVLSLNYNSSGSQPGLYAGGYFTSAAGNSANHTAYWNGLNWFPLPYFPATISQNGVAGTVFSVKYDTTNTIVVNGGSFTTALEATSYVYSKNVVYYNINTYSWNPMKEIVVPYGVKNVSSPSGEIYAVVAYGTDIYVGGDFSNAGGIYAKNIAKYDSTTNIWYGLVDSVTKVNGVNGIVRALYLGATSGDNGLYAGGNFTEAGGITVNNVARWSLSGLNWFSLTDSTFGVIGTDGPVYALTSDNSDLYVGGTFTTAGGQGINNIAKWNGNTWNPLIDSFSNQGTNGTVYTITWGSSLSYTIVFGGSFTQAGYQTATNIAAWDGTNFTSLSNGSGEGTNGPVYALAVGGWGIPPTTQTIIYAGGNFTQVANGSVTANYVAAFVFGGTWSALGNNTVGGGPVRSLYYPGTPSSSPPFDTRLFIGGDFAGAGILDFGTTSYVWGLVLFTENGSSLTSSYFNTLPFESSPTTSGNFLYNSGTTGVKWQTGNPSVNSIYYLGASKLLVGGKFERAYTSTFNSEINTHNVAIMTISSTWTTTPSPIPELNGQVRSIRKVGTNIYVGGDFSDLYANNQNLNYLTYWDTTNNVWMSIVSGAIIGVNNIVYTLDNAAGFGLFVGGNFTTGGTTILNRIGILNTSTFSWSQMTDALSVDVGVNGIVRDINYSGGNAYICGDFTTTGSGTTPIYRVAKINSSNKIVQIKNNSGTHIGLNGTSVYSNLYISPNIYFGGTFSNALPTSDLPMVNLAYFTAVTITTPLTINTSTAGFLDTEDGTTYSQIVIPAQYKLTTLIYNISLNKWLETYRTSGVTH